MRKVLVSACLMGRRVRYDGRAKPVGDDTVTRWREEGRLVVHCPEIAGGLPVPRPPAEIEPGADAADVLAGRARIRTPEGVDVTDHFVSGARAALATARTHGVVVAVLKESSPSCGTSEVYDGAFEGRKVPGEGVTAHLLRENGVAVFNEDEVAQAAERLRALEAG
ncbi:DUF523 domain-containing protein [Nocardiopsis sp. L17-MgMaSL7]|jgi:uncharacterized protein YbbK (DUF523 family)|uniref:DUF523 domain-containing protein n=1 Tax=Nocardiopsis sp. L17-MgMaSL7 TaxID=1938893 RepID=UPI000D70E5AD|nr:DUF523 domain-containing protein [Nocardiopsis sp. L17-MgMaSL7]PWV54655.1 uncharacterized protein YbbK (DUF523 family) [Nocardiopsis sp. L17-MgMaSL7]